MNSPTRRGSHQVTVSVSIVQAVETSEKPPPFYETTRNGKRKRIFESVHPQHRFHMEYRLLPGEERAKTYKTDVIMFGIVAKVHTEHDERVVNVWQEDGLTFYGWRHRHTFRVTKADLLGLHSHELRVRVWNSLDKMSMRARFDRPKAFRLPAPSKQGAEQQVDAEDSEGLTSGSCRPERLPVVHQEKGKTKRRRRIKQLSDGEGEDSEPQEGASPSNKRDSKISFVTEENEGGEGAEASKMRDPHADAFSLSDPGKLGLSSILNLSASHEDLSLSVSSALRGLSRRRQKQMQMEAAEQARVEREGIAVLKIKMADLFAVGEDTVSACLGKGAGNLKAFEVSVNLETPLLSEELSKALNPMAITVCRATNLPPPPLPPEEMERRCEGIFVHYQFPFKPAVETSRRLPHSSSVVWGERSTMLLGTIPPELLLETLRGAPLAMELHDKDRKRKGREDEEEEPARFGTVWEDDLLGTCAYNKAIRRHLSSESLSPCGVAKLDLSCLLQGQSVMELALPVLNSPSCASYAPTAEDGMRLLVAGDYLHNQTQLVVKIQLTHSLSFPPLSAVPTSRPLCPFGRVVYMVKSQELANQILGLANSLTATALGLTGLEQDTLRRALSTYKLTREQMSSNKCDVITGFHFQDSDHFHILMLEGLHDKGVLQLWGRLPHHRTQDAGIVKVFYNSEYSFSQRLYGELDVDLTHITLQQPLGTVVQQAGIYLRGALPLPCFQAIMVLSELQYASEMAELCRRSLFPTVDMVFSLSLQCQSLVGTPSTELAFPETKELEPPQRVTSTERKWRRRGRSWHPLDNHNPAYQELVERRRSLPPTDHIMQNIMNVRTASEQIRTDRGMQEGTRQRPWTLSESEVVHNYSTHTYNSVELSKARLREVLSPSRRYTYSQQLHSMTLEPGDAQAEERQRTQQKRQMWMSAEGFIFPGFKTALSCNAHLNKPDEHRLEQLREPFQDNLLHANTLKPTVSWMHFSWEKRGKDFERYRPPPLCFGPTPPVTIHLAGESRAKEQGDFTQRERERWQSKLVVDDMNFVVVRRGIRTELSNTASCQADKLKSMLKHDPTKKGLAPSEDLRVDNMPALAVLSTASEEEEQGSGVVGFKPGPHSNRSLRLSCNVIPIFRPDPAPSHPREFQQLSPAVERSRETSNRRIPLSS